MNTSILKNDAIFLFVFILSAICRDAMSAEDAGIEWFNARALPGPLPRRGGNAPSTLEKWGVVASTGSAGIVCWRSQFHRKQQPLGGLRCELGQLALRFEGEAMAPWLKDHSKLHPARPFLAQRRRH